MDTFRGFPNTTGEALTFIADTGRDLNDLGRYTDCKDQNFTRYVVLSIEDLLPLGMYVGICGPLNCTAPIYTELFSEGIAQSLENALWGTGIPEFRVNVSASNIVFYDSQEELSKQHEIKTGNIVAFAIFGVLILCVLIGTLIELRPAAGFGGFVGKSQHPNVNYKIPQDVAVTGRDSVTTYVEDEEESNSRAGSIDVGASTLELHYEDRTPSCVERFFSAFAAGQNAKSLFLGRSKEGDRNMEVWNGVRVFSMGWIILGHTMYYGLNTPLQNITVVNEMFSRKSFQIIFAAPFAVDVFFYMTGFLSTYLLANEFHKREGSAPNLLLVYVHRFFRLIPLYGLVMLFFAFLLPLFGNGPIFFQFSYQVEQCRKYWWTNLLFINNFFRHYCMGWTWYIPNDMQFFMTVPILVWVFFKSNIIGYVVIIALTCASFVVNMLVIYHHEFYVTYRENSADYFYYYYNMPWNRCPPFFIGMLVALFYYSYKKLDRETSLAARFSYFVRERRYMRWLGYLLAAAIINFFIFIQYPLNNYPEDTTQLQNALFMTFSRSLFIIALSLFLYPVLLGRNRIAHGILSF